MKLENLTSTFLKLHGDIPVWNGIVNSSELRSLCEQVLKSGGKLVAIWGEDKGKEREIKNKDQSEKIANARIKAQTTQGFPAQPSLFEMEMPPPSESVLIALEDKPASPSPHQFTLHIALVFVSGLLVLTHPLNQEHPEYPDVSDLFPAAERMQRAVFDMFGFYPTGVCNQRKWLRHDGWPSTTFPLRKSFNVETQFPTGDDNYPFVTVTGNGVHEIAVGPVHAGTIEPGHFRFSVVGERVLRLEQRLGYKHKGIEKRFEGLTLQQGAKLAGRISGDSTVAYAWAYAQAVESVTHTSVPPRAVWLRALFLELERMLNHLGDLGYLGNDVALVFGFTQFWILKEDLLRMNNELFGHRYLMDRIMPGGVACDLDNAGLLRIAETLRHLEHETAILKDIYEEHAGMQDRFLGTGVVLPELAARLGLTGLAGRASGQAWDVRAQFPSPPYEELDVQMATHRNGDVAARVIVRFEEINESIRLIRLMLERLPVGELLTGVGKAKQGSLGIGWVEGWRGEILLALHTAKNNRIQRLHPHDPSWQNWPVLEHAIMDNIVPDFPLINKSFNLSYCGVDL